ncbi:Penicillin-binding protein 2 [Tepidanaerobacter acetatoxydans Re1]|uniref:Penicillin-binding protein 2 n=1 Tax=Tepidanaerobacter acetatoxydans (strain DSM 21804 / JCM 16047 / Re1) TaxID=1209989 RepID=F4LW13_TEPAE|nr:penicillin-binding protein 2 [Tepidanaerobacter acetatoxydans]AEE91681.1 penicillin-binding protein 2 [Tepidanaerobacter acetatoxydans Re1]CCP26430.1 Penicillin-binding protein 2 [Tepidanaerobacter acetatoxydans Re1]
MDVKKLQKRLNVLLGIVVLIFVVLTISLLTLQIVKGNEYEKLAEENRIRLIPITAPRGVFKDRYGRELVNNRPSFTVSYMSVKTEESEQEEVFEILRNILEIPHYTEISNQTYTVDKDKKIILSKLPIADRNGNGEVDIADISITDSSTGKQVLPSKVDFATGTVTINQPPNTQVMVSYNYDTLKNKLQSQDYKPVRLKTDVDFQTVAEIEERRLPGVVIEVEPLRNYIYGSMGSHVFGYVGEISQEELDTAKDNGYRPGDLIGKMGLEKVLESYLKGTDGGQQVEVTASGKLIKVLGQKEPIPGNSINLTLDIKLQQIAENKLREQLIKLQTDKYKPFPNAKRGAVVAINIKTGEVLAMASVPDFDPNMFARGITQKEWEEISKNPLNPMVNLAISGTFPPGSIFKMVTATAALEEKVTNERELIRDTGVYWTILPKKCWKAGGHGLVNIEKAIAESCNIYFYEMGRRLGIDNIEKYAKMYGLGDITGIELPNEKAGTVASREYKKNTFSSSQDKIWYPAETLDAAIGQGYHSFTPIQIADYIAAIANEGIWMKPHLIKSIVDADGNVVLEKNPEIGGRLDISDKTYEIIKNGMKGATLSGGTAYGVFADFPISVAGKTGTAEWDVSKDPHGWFVAFAPYEDPEIAVAVFIEQAGSGGTTGGPVARAIFEEYFHLTNENDNSEDYLVQP